MENKATFAIKITDLETGEVLLDRDDVVTYIGGVTFDDGVSASLAGANTDSVRIAIAIDSAEMAIKNVKESSPSVAALVGLVAQYREEETQEEK